MDLKEIECEVMSWIQLALGPVADSYEDNNEPLGSIKGGEFLARPVAVSF
jgi:hypothetical protein